MSLSGSMGIDVFVDGVVFFLGDDNTLVYEESRVSIQVC